MIPYFPLTSDDYAMPMNARAGVESLIQVEADKYAAQVALRREIALSDPEYYFQCPPDTRPLAWEALEILLPNMARCWPQYFTLAIHGEQWTWINHLLGETVILAFGGDALDPLAWLGTQIPEDLILMASQETHPQPPPQGGGGFRNLSEAPLPLGEGQSFGLGRGSSETVCVGGHLCFASGWDLGEKMGRDFLAIHDPVPEFRERIGTPADLLMRRLKAGRAVERRNWSISSSDQLNLAPKLAAQWQVSRCGITPENAGERVWFRVEQQTLTRLPRTQGILFTIHTYLNLLAEVVANPARRARLRAVLGQFPPAMLEYKGMTPYYHALMAYLARE